MASKSNENLQNRQNSSIQWHQPSPMHTVILRKDHGMKLDKGICFPNAVNKQTGDVHVLGSQIDFAFPAPKMMDGSIRDSLTAHGTWASLAKA